MARSKNIFLDGVSGAIGKEFVCKQYAYGTVITKYPDMSKIKPSITQKRYRGRFQEAVRYAQGILQDASKKAEFQRKIGKGKSVYHAAIKEYLATAH